MINFVRGLKVRNFLDIGCISEMTRIFTYHLNCEGVGVNISKKLSRVTMEKVKKLKFIYGDIERLKINKKFDLVICGETLEHLQDVDNFIVKIREVLTDNGYLLLTLPNLASLFNRIPLLFCLQPRGINPSRKILLNPFTKYDYNWGHVSMFTFYSIKKFLKANGFRILKMRGTYGGHEVRIR